MKQYAITIRKSADYRIFEIAEELKCKSLVVNCVFPMLRIITVTTNRTMKQVAALHNDIDQVCLRDEMTKNKTY